MCLYIRCLQQFPTTSKNLDCLQCSTWIHSFIYQCMGKLIRLIKIHIFSLFVQLIRRHKPHLPQATFTIS